MLELLNSKPYLYPVVFAGLALLILYVLSRMGGWNRLAENYKSSREFVGEKWYMQTIRIGLVNYKNAITIGCNNVSLYLSVLFPFSFGHPKLEIPLSDITGVERKGMLVRYIELSFRRAPDTKLRLYKMAADRVEQASKGAWSYERL